ncbi:lactococcin G-beta/enterocin 1071B family bacteriocin [Bifidobacterium aemilianum]|uniref:lactococcin G-beta/enterocin 1071B family bacteriocin n=1 Tax=Bifidobacterium aemilianum TaxID=2493120 RepID=UPI000FDD2C26|nr:lactococcin G-beta/enterocin 1071B family bacteriocin [Bifidobacterium aemilianum]
MNTISHSQQTLSENELELIQGGGKLPGWLGIIDPVYQGFKGLSDGARDSWRKAFGG